MNAEEYSKRGDNYFTEKNFERAIEDFSETIKLEPDNPFAYYKRGLSYTNKKEFDLAIADFNAAIKIEPNKFGHFYFDRALAYSFKGNTDSAMSDLEMAIKIDPQNKDYCEAIEELKKSKPSETVKASSGNFLDDLTDWDPTYDPRGQLKRRNIAFLIVLSIGLIIGAIALGTSYQTQWIIGGIVGAILGAIYGFGIVNLLRFVVNEWANIKVDFAFLADLDEHQGDGIFALIKDFLLKLLFVLFRTLIWRPFKLICYALYLSPFIGIYQGIKLLIEQRKQKR